MTKELYDLKVEEISIVGGNNLPGPAVPQSRFLVIKSEDGDIEVPEEEVKKAKKQFSDLSYAPWSSVDKSKLPKEAFLWVEDPEKKATWHLPYREGSGEIDKETGMYTQVGKINYNGLVAMLAAMNGAHSGKPMTVPDAAKKNAEALFKKYNIGKYREEVKVEKEALKLEEEVKIDYEDLSDDAKERVGKSLFQRLISKFSPQEKQAKEPEPKKEEIDISKAMNFQDASKMQNMTKDMSSKFYLLEDILRNIMTDKNESDKVGKAKEAIDQYLAEMDAMMQKHINSKTDGKGVKKMAEETLKTQEKSEDTQKVEKVGKKISAANLDTLRRIQELITSLIDSSNSQKNVDEEVVKGAGADHSLIIEERLIVKNEDVRETPDVQEEISKAIDEKLTPVVKSIESLAKSVEKLMNISGLSKDSSETPVKKEEGWEFSGLCNI